ncbi:hypothetical protein GOBAR_DD00703 [Gossypium barbadense]|nr:hypothetical protein GOBAR_DD00703 [Gossypium barbadense]
MSEILSVAEFVVGASPASWNSCIGHATKKVRRQPDLPLDFDDPIVDGNGRKLAETIVPKISYKNTLIGSQSATNLLANGEDFELYKYLTVCPWSPNFSTTHTEVDTQVVWVRFPGLLEGYYSDFLLKAIGQTIGPILNIDENTNIAKMGRFARLVVCIDLRKPLI